MKKEYVKPYIAVESFQLDAAIAASCTAEGKAPVGYNLNDCVPDPVIVGAHMTYIGDLCVHDVEVLGDGNDLVCYHGPVDYNTMFMAS